ncbi:MULTISPECIES: serine/threonine-protein kinase [unclassified Corallococcus]|uniref:serine/threonine-protein kinase n=1 Tax=unclassified Corallococcus TaxID=2685029 RepID=UPI001A8FA4E9|nr:MULTISPECIES: serine/threonine-protein kinase [unclassified Corallococcus]MBN9682342.1 protein kinase [Corallococcus sp. NCSPR001]WAS86105.1 protein kinase [Corallococcus sp. NCRR]
MNSSTQPARLRPFRPQPFGRYTLLSHLATGGMGEIYLARLEGAQGFEKLCVIKKILPQFAEDQDFVDRFVGEARTLVRLGHGSIAQVLDMGVHEGEAYMALEYVDGKDLRKVAARVRDRQTPLPLTFVLYVMGRVLDALAYAHRKRDEEEKELKLVHRDISPQNILISYEGEVKVIDFGLAKSRLSAAKTNPSIILGKFLYMSPEQARHQPVDRRSDLYAVGLCLYELISGKNPFDALPPGELMSAVANPKVAPLGEVEPLTPPAVSQLVAKALAVDPAQRFQNAEDFRGRLQACLMEIDTSAGPESVSKFMRDLFSADYQSERRLLTSLREVSRDVRGSGTYEALAPAPRPAMQAPPLPPKTIRLDGPVEPLSFHPTPRSREDGGGARDDGETRPGVMVDESTRPAFPVEALEEAARAKMRPSPASSEPSPTVEVRQDAMDRPTILEGLPAIRLPSDRAAEEQAPALGEPTAPRADALPGSESQGEPTAPRAPSLPYAEPGLPSRDAPPVPDVPVSRPFADAGGRGASLPFSDSVGPRGVPPPPMAPVAAARTAEGPVPFVPVDASRPVAPPPMPSFDSGAGRFESAGESLPFMEPPPPPDGPFADDEELPESPFPWPEPLPEGGRSAGAELRAAEVRIPEGQRPTAAMPSLASARPGVTTPSNGSRPAAPPAFDAARALEPLPAYEPVRASEPLRGFDSPRAAEPARAVEARIPEGQRPTAAMPSLSSSRPGVTTPSNGSRPAPVPLPSYAAPTIQVPSIQPSASRSFEAEEDSEPLDAGPAPRPTMQDTRPSEDLVSVDARALEADSSVPYISAEPDDAPAAREGDADTHPRIPMPRASRREEPQARVMLDESLLRETSSSTGKREADTGPTAPARGKTGSRRAVRGSSPSTPPPRSSTASSMRAVARAPAPAVEPDESSTSRTSRDDSTRRKAIPVRPEPAEPPRASRREPAPVRKGGALRSALVFLLLMVVALGIVGAGLYFVPELRVAAGLEQSRTSTPPPPTPVQQIPIPPGPPQGRPPAPSATTDTPPAQNVAAEPAQAPTEPDATDTNELADDLLGPGSSAEGAAAPTPAAKKAAPARPAKRPAPARAPAKESTLPPELEKEWAQTKTLFRSLKNNHGCEAMSMQCTLFDKLADDFIVGGSETPTLKQVKDLHEQLRNVKRRQDF